MTSYQGPNASVTQQFVVSPGAVAVESLPSVAVATAYDVYNKKSLGNFYGIIADRDVPWGTTNTVIYNNSVAGVKAFTMYPPKAYVNSRFGNIDLGIADADIGEAGISIGRDEMYVVPNTTKNAGSCQAIVPYYSATANVQILATDLSTVIITGGSVVTAQVKPGMKIWINGSQIGVVGSVGNDETKIRLASPGTADSWTGVSVIIGADTAGTLTIPSVLFDPTANFVSNKVAVGDIISLSSLAITGSVATPLTATITAVINKNTLRFNTTTLTAGNADSNFTKYQAFTTIVGSTIQVYSYNINRLVGFSQSYQLKLKNTNDGIDVNKISSTSFSILESSLGSTVLHKGDLFSLNTVNTSTSQEERDRVVNIYEIDTITLASAVIPAGTTTTTQDPDLGNRFIITTTTAILNNSDSSGFDENFIDAWFPVIETEIVSDFRAIRSQEHNVVHRITGIKDIFNFYVNSGETSIDPRNELAFMLNEIFALSGGKVCYGVNVDSSAENLTTEYDIALEELKLVDVYSHCFGTTDAGVNGIVGSYCDDQSAPYEAHERIGLICYDTDDLYLMGSDGIVQINGSGATPYNQVTLTGSVNLITAGVTVGDKINVFDTDGNFVLTTTVTQTPVDTYKVLVDYNGTPITSGSVKIESGRKDDQSVRAGSVQYGNRRVTQIFPGWFYAVFNGTRMLLPPYFISAAITGLDSGTLASQPLTNFDFSIPGISNIELGTNTYFKKEQLDEIGGGGVDIMIQDTAISQTIKSRHDLTTNMDAVQFMLRSITKQADVSAKTLRTAVNPYVGKYNVQDPNLFRFLGEVCSVVCTKLITNKVIFNIIVNNIVRDEVIDNKINFFVKATAYIEGDYYDITMLVTTR
jgi:hypothetical protein